MHEVAIRLDYSAADGITQHEFERRSVAIAPAANFRNVRNYSRHPEGLLLPNKCTVAAQATRKSNHGKEHHHSEALWTG